MKLWTWYRAWEDTTAPARKAFRTVEAAMADAEADAAGEIENDADEAEGGETTVDFFWVPGDGEFTAEIDYGFRYCVFQVEVEEGK